MAFHNLGQGYRHIAIALNIVDNSGNPPNTIQMKCFQVCILLIGLLGVPSFQTGISLHSYVHSTNDALSMIELVTKHGYKIEEHNITTEDGYILSTFRILPGRNCLNQTTKKPVLFVHGLFSSSFDFVSGGSKKSLAYILADKCHDVWLTNSRGNGVSMKHVNLTTSDPEFWDFSWHEMGVFDTPAAIDYILKETNETSLHYIGHSQGTTHFFVFTSERPQYHSKIASMQALAPVASFEHVTYPPMKFFFENYGVLEVILRIFGIHDFSATFELVRTVGTTICDEDKHPEMLGFCSYAFCIISGGDLLQMNTTVLFNTFLEHFPSGASSKQLSHFSQMLISRKFRQFDYGIYKNLEVYGSMFPPAYNISAANVPVSIYYSTNDYLATVKDVEELHKQLPNVVESYEVPFSQFTHYDFIIAIDAPVLLWNRVAEVIEKFS